MFPGRRTGRDQAVISAPHATAEKGSLKQTPNADRFRMSMARRFLLLERPRSSRSS
jgi:hypothetical protein